MIFCLSDFNDFLSTLFSIKEFLKKLWCLRSENFYCLGSMLAWNGKPVWAIPRVEFL